MRRPNTTREELDRLLEQLTYENVVAAIAEYLNADDRKEWMKAHQSGPSRRYFLTWLGEKLDAKAIAKGALKANGYRYEGWHTDPIIDALEDLGFAVWDADRDGAFDLAAATNYEIAKRLARPGQQRFRSEAMALWGHSCAVSGVSLDTALEAAHIVPHSEAGQMSARNSIILRADLHRLFDAGLMAIDPHTLQVKFHRKAEQVYADFKRNQISLPDDGPTAADFEERWQMFQPA
jgi:hypothetical protein